MNTADANALNPGDRVVYAPGTVDEAHGVVTRVVLFRAVHVDWDDGQRGSVHVDDMTNYTREDPAAYRDLMSVTQTLAGYYIAMLKLVRPGTLNPAAYQNVTDDEIDDIIRDMLDHRRIAREV
jgi:hypothetical protein